MAQKPHPSRGKDNLGDYLSWRVAEEKRLMSRRQFLAVGGLAVGGLALAACSPEAATTTTTTPGAAAATTSAGAATTAPPTTAAAGAAKGATLDVLMAAHTGSYRLAAQAFEQANDATLNYTVEQFGLMPTLLTPAFESGGHTWDVVYIWRAWMEQYKDFLIPLDELGLNVDASDFRWEALEASQALDGRFYGMPSNVYTYVLYGNRKRLEEVGVSELPTTYSDFVDLARELTGDGKLGYTDGWAPLYLQPKWNVWLHLNGGTLYSQGETGDVLFNTPEAMQATQDMKDLLPYMPAESPTSPWGIYDVEAKKVFFDETAAMIIDYQHIWYQGQDPNLSQIGEGNVMVGLIPGGKSGGPQSATQSVGECFAIPKTSQNKEAALELVKFYSSPEAQLGLLTNRAEIAAFDPADESGYPAYTSLYTDPSIPAADQPNIDATLAQAEFPGARYGTRPAYQAIADTIEAAVSSALLGETDVEAAHAVAQDSLDQIVSEEG